MINPFSHNVIFFDTEFTHLDPKIGELLSIGMVNAKGKELYLEFEYEGSVHPWVKKRVLPTLTQKKVSKEEGRKKIEKFVGDSEPFLIAYVNQFDAIYWYNLFGSPQKHPAFWIPIDFASILFAHGFDPVSMNKHRFFKMLGVDKEQFTQHNALDDARLLKEVYTKFYEYLNRV